MSVAPAAVSRTERPFDRNFVIVVASALSYFLGLGMLAPVLPRYVEDVLDGGGTQVGVAVGAFAVSAALLRPSVGRLGDARGRRVLLVGGTLVAAGATLGYGLPGGLAVLVLFRLVAGAGEAATFIGAATAAQDLSPPDRRGQGASLFSISIYGGLSFGPVIGEWIYRQHGPGWAWAVAAGFSVLASAIAMALPARIGMPADPDPLPGSRPDPGPAVADEPAGAGVGASPSTSPLAGRRRHLHPAGLRPGIVLALGASGYAGFASFVPLYVDEIGLDNAGPVFLEYGILVLIVRIFFSRLPDILGHRRGPLAALFLQAVGLGLMGLWAAPAGLYTATAIYAAGVSLLYPALFPAVVDGAPAAERSQAIATFTLFFDVAQGLGAPLLGIIVTVTENRGAFAGAALLSAIGFAVHQRSTTPTRLSSDIAEEPCPPPQPGE